MRTAANVTVTGKTDGRSVEITRQRMPDGGTISTYSDVTDRKKVERTKDEFVSTVSHELRTPLTSIQGALGLIVGGALGPTPPEMKAMIDIAHSNSERLVRLINDILDIEKIESGGLEFRLQRQPLSPILRKSIEANAGYAAKYNVRIRFEEGALDAQADVDADRLTQVMANLLSNAEKFSTPGDTVVVTLERRGKMLRISIADRGPGIPAEFRDKIFGRFAQADTSDSRKKGGTGLGLSIVKGPGRAHARHRELHLKDRRRHDVLRRSAGSDPVGAAVGRRSGGKRSVRQGTESAPMRRRPRPCTPNEDDLGE